MTFSGWRLREIQRNKEKRPELKCSGRFFMQGLFGSKSWVGAILVIALFERIRAKPRFATTDYRTNTILRILTKSPVKE